MKMCSMSIADSKICVEVGGRCVDEVAMAYIGVLIVYTEEGSADGGREAWC